MGSVVVFSEALVGSIVAPSTSSSNTDWVRPVVPRRKPSRPVSGAFFCPGRALVWAHRRLCYLPWHRNRHQERPLSDEKVFYLGNLHHKRQACPVFARKTVVYERPIPVDRDNRCDQNGLTLPTRARDRENGRRVPGFSSAIRVKNCAITAPMPLSPAGTRRRLDESARKGAIKPKPEPSAVQTRQGCVLSAATYVVVGQWLPLWDEMIDSWRVGQESD